MPGQKERPLELSDFASELNREILANPYKFLGLPETATIAEVRQTYINATRRYHPDMINPSFDSQNLREIYVPGDFATIQSPFSKELCPNLEDIFKKVNEILAKEKTADPKEKELRAAALKAIQTAAHEKMVKLNTAYEVIKARFDPKRWNSPLGYEHIKQYNPREKDFEQEIKLEANAELTLYPYAYEYWVPGAYIEYDWGPVPDHEWYDEEIFRECTVVKHLFVYKELSEGRQQISQVLLDTFYKNFGLDENQQETFVKLLLGGRGADEIMKAMGIERVPNEAVEDRKRWLYALKFRRHINEMQALSTEPTWSNYPIEMRWENGKMILKGYTETIFSEADVMLLSTLAYGPMLVDRNE